MVVVVCAVAISGVLLSTIGVQMFRNMFGIEAPHVAEIRRHHEEQERRLAQSNTPMGQQAIMDEIGRINEGRRDNPPTYDELFTPPTNPAAPPN